ncbi:uncharacterized protein G2W53_008291 [Senna tora]|uniref:Uncharacterized protein n=1 Tax=Senna tora TaxID=362788 RepID=A0A834X965_9FABA|nr:uncharacterized protein G2W53_008291 [Senna tora]
MAHDMLLRLGHQPRRSRFSLLCHNTIAPPKPLVCTSDDDSQNPYSASPSIEVFTCLVDALEISWLMSGGMLPSITSHMQRLRSIHDPPACNKIWKLNDIGLEAFLKGLDSTSEHEADEVVILPVPPPTYKGKGKEKLSDMPEFPRQFPNGKTTELFHYPIAAIMSMGYEKRQSVTLLALGGFFVNVVVQLVNPLLKITVCSVNQFQWPLTKDTAIIRMGQRTFFFAFPGLLYALQFPRVCGPIVVAYLVRLFKRFSYYQDFADVSTAGSGK